MKTIKGGIAAPKGFTASGVNAGIKSGSTKKDCALIVSDQTANVAGTFTRNLVKAAPVEWCSRVCTQGTARAIFTNSGNANACTGEPGAKNTAATAAQVAAAIGLSADEVLVCSTGVIGVALPMDRVGKGVEACAAALSPEGSLDAATAIMTTDTLPKEIAVEVARASGTVRIGGMAKGAGMIAPNMATMLAFLTTDANVAPGVLQELLSKAVDQSFNCICVDNDMSPNDTALILANGASGLPTLTADSDDAAAFGEALNHVCQELAKGLVRDGEGATKFVEIVVDGTESDADAHQIAAFLSKSQLCKTAFFGEDPNWGRIACSVGHSGVPFDADAMNVWIGDVQVMKDGESNTYDEADAAAIMKQKEFSIRVCVGGGEGRAVFWTSDLSHDYVSINADYRT